MNKKDWNRVILLKVKLSLVDSLFFIIVWLSFIALGILWCLTGSKGSEYSIGTVLMAQYVYCPLVIHYLICAREQSKIYYLVPRTMEQRKAFIRYQVRLRIGLSLGIEFLYFIVIQILRPEVFLINICMYFFTCFMYTLLIAVNGMDIYYRKGQKKKKINLTFCIIMTVLTCIGVISVMGFIQFGIVKHKITLLMIGSVIASFVGIGYYLRYALMFRKLDATYENIRFEDSRLNWGVKQFLV